jgi:hypothetical protein
MKQGTDLERRLAARLRPARVLGAEETWARIAPTLDASRPGQWRALPALGIAAGAILVIAMASALVVTFQETSTGGLGSQPVAPTATAQPPVAMAGSMAAVQMGANGSLITTLVPTPPFAVFQPSALPPGMELIATAYNPAPAAPNQPIPATGGAGSYSQAPIATSQPIPAVSGAGSTLNGPGADPGLMQAAAQRGHQLLGDRQEVALALIYAASADDQIELVQRSASGKALPAGEPLTVHSLPAVKTQRDGRTVITWIEAGTYLEFGVTSPTEARLQLASSLHETALVAPEPVSATPVAATGAGAPAAGAVPALPNVPLSQRRGPVTVPRPDWAAITQQCGAWDASLRATAPQAGTEQLMCVARLITGRSGDGGYGFSPYAWHQAAKQLGLDPASGPSSDTQVWLATIYTRSPGVFTTQGNAGSALVLDAETGQPIVQVELLPVP